MRSIYLLQKCYRIISCSSSRWLPIQNDFPNRSNELPGSPRARFLLQLSRFCAPFCRSFYGLSIYASGQSSRDVQEGSRRNPSVSLPLSLTEYNQTQPTPFLGFASRRHFTVDSYRLLAALMTLYYSKRVESCWCPAAIFVLPASARRAATTSRVK